jgi:hypothetical protein
MFCEAYRQRLMDAAISGAALPPTLAAHLEGCARCADAFAAEQALFGAISDLVQARANGEVPASLLPRIRAAFPEDSFPAKGFGWSRIWLPATAAVLVITLILAISRIGPPSAQNPAALVAGVQKDPGTFESQNVVVPSLPSRVANAGAATNQGQGKASKRLVSVRVEPDAEVAMQRLIRITREQPDTLNALSAKKEADAVIIEPIEVKEITFAPLHGEGGATNANEPER